MDNGIYSRLEVERQKDIAQRERAMLHQTTQSLPSSLFLPPLKVKEDDQGKQMDKLFGSWEEFRKKSSRLSPGSHVSVDNPQSRDCLPVRHREEQKSDQAASRSCADSEKRTLCQRSNGSHLHPVMRNNGAFHVQPVPSRCEANSLNHVIMADRDISLTTTLDPNVSKNSFHFVQSDLHGHVASTSVLSRFSDVTKDSVGCVGSMSMCSAKSFKANVVSDPVSLCYGDDALSSELKLQECHIASSGVQSSALCASQSSSDVLSDCNELILHSASKSIACSVQSSLPSRDCMEQLFEHAEQSVEVNCKSSPSQCTSLPRPPPQLADVLASRSDSVVPKTTHVGGDAVWKAPQKLTFDENKYEDLHRIFKEMEVLTPITALSDTPVKCKFSHAFSPCTNKLDNIPKSDCQPETSLSPLIESCAANLDLNAAYDVVVRKSDLEVSDDSDTEAADNGDLLRPAQVSTGAIAADNRYSHINKNSHSSSRESSSDSDGSSDSESSSFESGDDYCIGTNTYRKEKPLSVGVETAGKQKQCRRLTQASDITHSYGNWGLAQFMMKPSPTASSKSTLTSSADVQESKAGMERMIVSVAKPSPPGAVSIEKGSSTTFQVQDSVEQGAVKNNGSEKSMNRCSTSPPSSECVSGFMQGCSPANEITAFSAAMKAKRSAMEEICLDCTSRKKTSDKSKDVIPKCEVRQSHSVASKCGIPSSAKTTASRVMQLPRTSSNSVMRNAKALSSEMLQTSKSCFSTASLQSTKLGFVNEVSRSPNVSANGLIGLSKTLAGGVLQTSKTLASIVLTPTTSDIVLPTPKTSSSAFQQTPKTSVGGFQQTPKALTGDVQQSSRTLASDALQTGRTLASCVLPTSNVKSDIVQQPPKTLAGEVIQTSKKSTSVTLHAQKASSTGVLQPPHTLASNASKIVKANNGMLPKSSSAYSKHSNTTKQMSAVANKVTVAISARKSSSSNGNSEKRMDIIAVSRSNACDDSLSHSEERNDRIPEKSVSQKGHKAQTEAFTETVDKSLKRKHQVVSKGTGHSTEHAAHSADVLKRLALPYSQKPTAESLKNSESCEANVKMSAPLDAQLCLTGALSHHDRPPANPSLICGGPSIVVRIPISGLRRKPQSGCKLQSKGNQIRDDTVSTVSNVESEPHASPVNAKRPASISQTIVPLPGAKGSLTVNQRSRSHHSSVPRGCRSPCDNTTTPSSSSKRLLTKELNGVINTADVARNGIKRPVDDSDSCLPAECCNLAFTSKKQKCSSLDSCTVDKQHDEQPDRKDDTAPQPSDRDQSSDLRSPSDSRSPPPATTMTTGITPAERPPLADSTEPLNLVEQRLESQDFFMQRGKEFKHFADKVSSKPEKLMPYLKSILYFIMWGYVYEKQSVVTGGQPQRSYTIFYDTLQLHLHVNRIRLSIFQDGAATERDKTLSVLILRIQSLLYLKLYNFRKYEVGKLKTILDAEPSKHQVLWNKNGTGTPSPMSPTPSPACSIGSIESQGSADHGGVKVGNGAAVGSAVSSPASISVPQRIHSVTQQYLKFTGHLLQSHECWDQSLLEIQHYGLSEFFANLDNRYRPLSFHSNMPHMVSYVNRALQQLGFIHP